MSSYDTPEAIWQKVRELAAAQGSGAAPEAITPETRFVEDLQYDSLDVVEFVMTVEDAFGISISDDQASKIHTVGEAAELVREARSIAAQSA